MIDLKRKISNATPIRLKKLRNNIRSNYQSSPNLLKRFKATLKSNHEYPKELREKEKFILIGTPHFGNLGDQAIAKAQVDFLTNNFPNREIIEVQINEINQKLYALHKVVTKKDIIFFQGGGNIGDIYVTEENIRRKVLRYFRDIPIIQFPQSITYKDMSYNNYSVHLSQKIYSNRSKDFIIVTRESKSYNLANKLFPKNKTLYTPDIVLSLPRVKSDDKREGILFCMRKDSEKVLDVNQEKKLIQLVKERYKKINLADTEVPYFIYNKDRDKELKKIWDEYLSSRLVITDRLHGMIFAIITGTPCIVFDNFNSKIKMTYLDWLSDYKNIRFINIGSNLNLENIMTEIEEIIDGDVPTFDSANLYDPLINAINKLNQNK
ncbi:MULTISPECIES: polysaccharide pyruvyl transferase family protein [unclassified Lactococcus]|uniref:polysaccharide pyruvyl transferase family protein n=1 Tax=unclassified Lactococcus TaxID=2643510 RepID=UPI0011C777FB|nr:MULTISPECIES: polysaccharide pyruvyl transferase family protein [unclassified Lactococcus]MQW23458.1 hypothetical protein [Lactococcus sp. dk101]TXK36873.1 hypothetical protein FVP42_10505 [Lactococcus sp. dk310]TXK46831.1 hypothetical protein FVP43_10775 [Lactococcus sp. dk322]